MKLYRILGGLSLAVMLIAGTGCGQKTIVVPTDEEARKRAEPQPPPPSAFGGSNAKEAPKGSNPLKTVGMPGDAGGAGAGEKK